MRGPKLSSMAVNSAGHVQPSHLGEEFLVGSHQLSTVEPERPHQAFQLDQRRNAELGVESFLYCVKYGLGKGTVLFDQVNHEAGVKVELSALLVPRVALLLDLGVDLGRAAPVLGWESTLT